MLFLSIARNLFVLIRARPSFSRKSVLSAYPPNTQTAGAIDIDVGRQAIIACSSAPPSRTIKYTHDLHSIFDPRNIRAFQPPLQYYLQVLSAKEWDDVTILTAAWQDKSLNPTYPMLEMMANAGTLGKNVKLFKVSRYATGQKQKP